MWYPPSTPFSTQTYTHAHAHSRYPHKHTFLANGWKWTPVHTTVPQCLTSPGNQASATDPYVLVCACRTPRSPGCISNETVTVYFTYSYTPLRYSAVINPSAQWDRDQAKTLRSHTLKASYCKYHCCVCHR